MSNVKCLVYMDHAATTPSSKEVSAAMEPYFSREFGNPSSIYAIGRDAKEAVIVARDKAAALLSAESPSEIIFTSGATESNNLAIKGVAFYASQILGIKPHIIASSIEHHCVLDSVKYLEKNFGVEVTYLPVDKAGSVDPRDVEKAIKPNTVLISVMFGNNEIGTVEPITEIGKVIKKAKNERLAASSETPLVFHTDAVQAFQYLDCDVNKLGVDMLSLTAHKFYGPKGVGLLYVRRGTKFLPQQQGGTQEGNRRAGTENVAYIVGMVEAMANASDKRSVTSDKVRKLTDYLIKRIGKEIPDAELTGPMPARTGIPGGEKSKRLPHIAAFLFKRIEGESILINLDMAGIAASSGSACTSGSLEPSHVTKSMGYADIEAHGAVRFSLGKLNSREDIDKLMEVLPQVVEKLRAMSPIR